MQGFGRLSCALEHHQRSTTPPAGSTRPFLCLSSLSHSFPPKTTFFPPKTTTPTGPNVGFALIKAVSTKVQESPNVEVLTNTKVSQSVLEPEEMQFQLCAYGQV